jgi:hypothetical protein
MAISGTAAAYEEDIGGQTRRLLLRNGEIERFEVQYAPFGIFALWEQLFGRGDQPQVRHVRDLIALGLVGGGMKDREADELVASLPPSENLALRQIAQRLLGVTFMPAVAERAAKKKEAGSRRSRSGVTPDTTPAPASPTSAA